MTTLADNLRLLRAQMRRFSPPGANRLDAVTVQRIFCIDTTAEFESLEDKEKQLAEGVQWRRRRLAWNDASTHEGRGLCVNEVRVSAQSSARIEPNVAMANPGLVDFDAIENAYWQTYWAGGALRAERGVKESRLFLNMRELTCARSNAPRGPWEDLQEVQRRIDAGEWTPDLADLIPILNPETRRVEETPIELVRYLPAFPPSWCVQADERVLVATNGGYFLNFPEEYDDGVSALHQPVGALYANFKLHIPPWVDRPCAVEWEDGVRSIELLGPENIRLQVKGVEPINLVRGIAEPNAPAVVWRGFDEEFENAPASLESVDLVFAGAGLVTIVAPGTRKPPIGGAIVRLSGNAAQPWKRWLEAPREAPFPEWALVLQTSRNAPLGWVMAAGPKLIVDGRPLVEEEMFLPVVAGEFSEGNGAPPTRFPYDARETRAPRTAIGLNANEEWVLVVVDGRADPAHSIGCTLEEMARLMHELGCFAALNLDGGGSSVMAVEGIHRLEQLVPGITSGIVNIPSDPGHAERLVPAALTVTI